MTKPTPLFRQPAPPVGIITQRPLATKATQAAEAVGNESFIEDLGALAGAFAWLSSGAGANQQLLPPELRQIPPPDPHGGRLAAWDAGEGLRSIADLYADQRIGEEEVPALAKARARLERVLEMEPAIGMLSPPVQRRLREQLFNPLRELVGAANKHADMVKGAVEARDVDAFRQRLVGAIDYAPLDLSKVERRSDINGAQRYAIGDPIRIVDGNISALGYVTGRREDGSLIAEWLDLDNRIHLVEMSPEKVAKENPLKIGDRFDNWGHTYWVTGLNQDQHLRVVDEKGTQYEAFDVLNALMPLERLARASVTGGLYAGNASSKTIMRNVARAGEVALHTHRGHGYKDWNEDAGAAFVDGHGRIYVGIFDQAGGEGSDESARGAASQIAGQEFFEQTREVARSHGSIEDGEQALQRSIQSAHQKVIGRGRREVTTFVGAMIDGREAVILNLGDSGAMHFDAGGGFIDKTKDQGVGRYIFDGIGYPHEDGRLPSPDPYRWKVSQGQYLVFGSDGLLDAGLSEQQIGWIIARAGSAEAATRELEKEVSNRMKSGQGKKDNLTISVVRVGTPAA